jgi:H-NS histone family
MGPNLLVLSLSLRRHPVRLLVRHWPDATRRSAVQRYQDQPVGLKPKYRDRATDETWSGRGRMATWLKDKQDAGEDIEKYRASKVSTICR